MRPLAFIIITYNRPDDLAELVRNIAGLEGASDLLEDVVIVNNASTADYAPAEAAIREHPELPVRFIRSEENLGVARGRNLAVTYSQAPLLIMLDDDAVLQNTDCLRKLVAEFDRNNTERPKAIVSFKVLYYENLQLQRNTLPHKRFSEYKDKDFFETYFYAGGAHAIRRSVLDDVGHYPTDFFYGMEEYDLGYRILDRGYCIVYSQDVVMLHKESPLGRSPKADKVRMMWVNKSKVAWRYLPKRYYWSTAFLWSLFYLQQTGFDLRGFFRGWKEVLAITKTERRNPVSSGTIAYLRRLHARLFY